jgi:riboflavin-specific deaminase-like protein
MQFLRVLPPGPASPPESVYTGLDLGAGAPAERPYVFCNFVASADGKATASGRTAALGGEGDRRVFHLLRTQADAILAGTQTLQIERYGALVRSEEGVRIRLREGRPAQPLAVVISRRGDIPFEIPLFADSGSRVVLYAPAPTALPPTCAAEITVHELEDARRPLAEVLRSLRQDHDVRALLCEGGPTLFNALLVEGMVDELFLTLAPTLVGGQELGITAGAAPDRPLAMRMIWALEQGGDLFLRYRRA